MNSHWSKSSVTTSHEEQVPLREHSSETITGLNVRRNTHKAIKVVKKAASHRRRQAKAALLDMSSPFRRLIMHAIKNSLKNTLADDPAMCLGWRRCIRHAVDDIWQDVEREVEMAVQDTRAGISKGRRAFYDVESLKEMGDEPTTCFSGLRACCLYHLFPFDMSIFGNLQDPIFVVLTIVSMIPDVRVVFYWFILVLFAVPGPLDEYQLVQYILMFKSSSFLAGGVVMGFVGGLQYYICVQATTHSCDVAGPGSTTSVALGLVDLLGSCSLIWICFFLLPFSAKAAGLRRDSAPMDEVEVEPTDSTFKCFGCSWHYGRGGRLNGLYMYDLACFKTACLFLICLEAVHWRYGSDVGLSWIHFRERLKSWQFQATLFWARVFYSLLALPFFVFNLPVLRSILTHSVPTGYNRRGTVVAWLLPPVNDEEVHEEDEDGRGCLSTKSKRDCSLPGTCWNRQDV